MDTSDLPLRLEAIRAKGELNPAVIDDFRLFLRSAPDEGLFRMSPLRYAIAQGITEQEAIDLFLHATHAGILEFVWGVLCTGCMAFLTTPGGLRWLDRKQRCQFCKLDTPGSVDDRVEVAFTVAPAVRRIRFHTPEALDLLEDALRLFFSSSVALGSRPHQELKAQLSTAGRAPPGVVHELSLTLAEGSSVLLAPSSHAAVYLHARPGDRPRTVSFELFDGHAIPDSLEVPVGPVALRIANRTPQPVGYIVTCAGETWPAPAQPDQPLNHPIEPYLTGLRLISTQTFRDLFRAESIPSEGGLELKSVAVLFTDLKGSTAIYERVGDLRAYDLVRRHFTVLRSIAVAQGGAIVKTIGDAVMASFVNPAEAMRAAVLMNREIARVGEGYLLLKIGLHSGPCIAVELNDRLDYFGRTVNVAARVQGIADAGEIVCTEPVFESPSVQAVTAHAGLLAGRARVSLKGIEGDVPVVRLRQRRP